MLESWCGKVVEGGIEMTEIFGLAHWAGNDVVKTGKEHWRRCWAGAEGEDTSVTTRGRVQGDFLILGLLLSIRVSRLFIVGFCCCLFQD